MSPLARLSDALPDFSVGRSPLPRADIAQVARTAPPAPDPASVVRDAVARAEADLAARLGTEHAETLARLEADHAARLAGLEAQLAGDAARLVTEAVREAEERLTALTLDSTARILSQVMGDDLAAKSVKALDAVIREALRDDETMRIVVRGPQSIHEPLAAALGPRAGQLDFAEAAGFDMRVSIGDQLYESRLGEWSAAVEETLA